MLMPTRRVDQSLTGGQREVLIAVRSMDRLRSGQGAKRESGLVLIRCARQRQACVMLSFLLTSGRVSLANHAGEDPRVLGPNRTGFRLAMETRTGQD
jgi:hypothetical protein